MAQLLVRNISASLARELKRRAAEHGLSMEEEHRRILKAALAADTTAANRAFVAHLLSDKDTVDELPVRPRGAAIKRKVKF